MKKKLLFAAIGATMGVTSVAQADALLFPFFQADAASGVWSFVSLANVVGANANIHYTWNFDRLDTPTVRECVEENADGSLTAWDISQATVSDPSLSNVDIPAFIPDASGVNYSLAEPTLGFMVVDNGNLGESTLAGQLITVSAATGGVYVQRGMNNPASIARGTWNSIFTSHFSYDLTWYPDSLVTTSWYILVTGTPMAGIQQWQGAGVLTNGFPDVYDNDEVPRSGNVTLDIVCHDFYSRGDIMTPEQFIHSQNGGYMWLVFQPTNAEATGILATKIESTTLLGGVAATGLDNPWPNLPF